MTDGLGMRYAFMGAFETIHLNGEGGFSAHPKFRGSYPIYTCTLAMAEPWSSEVLFTPGELYPCQTGQHRRDCLGEGQV